MDAVVVKYGWTGWLLSWFWISQEMDLDNGWSMNSPNMKSTSKRRAFWMRMREHLKTLHCANPIRSKVSWKSLAIFGFLIWLLIDFQLYPIYWFGNSLRGHGDVVNPLVYTECSTKPSQSHLLITIPVVHTQVPRLLSSLEQWILSDVMPACSNSSESAFQQKHQPDLMIWFDLPLGHPKVSPSVVLLQNTIEESRQLKDAILSRCFGKILIDSANLTVQESRNSYWIDPIRSFPKTEGSNRQFFALIENSGLGFEYTHALIMEPDTFPVRPYWIDKVNEAANEGDFWIKGSVMRFEQVFSIAIEPYRSMYQYHINGNALYRLGDRCFESFLEDAKRYGMCELWCYDTCINAYLHSLSNLNLYHTVAHRFIISDFIAHLGGHQFDLNTFRRQSPNTALIHGKSHFVQQGI
uniref:Uncharacterized protein n=1 Tax=Timspurckia oligopyrenoides TaxID=708627 RepID=A0A6T6MI61_9RHOD|mmetsp:Transcript_12036/g.21781  ORF Transcript_12036/g.21781 Transcript_12036/m.21781 type:complete len:410 (+) Transcript_12036:249-1478(+)